MTDTARMRVTAEYTLTLDQLADAFCQLDDDAQAQFFVKAAAIMDAWPGALTDDWQAQAIGTHLRECECSTQAARDLIGSIHYAMTNAGGDS